MKKENTQITIAMSGGKDSSVSAALLKRAGFNVSGLFLKLYPSSDQEKKARAAAKMIGIPFSVLDLRKEFKKRVVDYFLKEEKKGRTPNPCVVCNEKIKFQEPFKRGGFLATGHYARAVKGRLFKGKDRKKDQSYFLWRLSSEKLDKIIFPLGTFEKKEVEKIAKDFNLPCSKDKESQEICFVSGPLCRFLSKHFPKKEGEIRDRKGNVLGRHQGLWLYTIGQRKGIGLPGGPFYVLKKDLEKNVLILTDREKDLYRKEAEVSELNWISGKAPNLPFQSAVKIRYRQDPVPAVLRKKGKNGLRISFSSPQRAVTPGQSAVFYKGEEVVGGGVIIDP